MKKNSPLYDDEIDLIALFKIIWDSKIKILFVTLISFLLGFGYNSQIPENYLNSLAIKPYKNTEFLKLDNIQKLLKSNQSNQTNQSNQSGQSNQSYLARFINELADYEEFLLIIKNTKKVQENISKLKIEDQEIKLFKYAKLLEIDVPKKNENNYTINFKWHDPEEAMKILKDTLDLTSNNLKIAIHNQSEAILEFEKKLVLQNDRVRLDYLNEQSSIAKELNISDNQVDGANLYQSNLSLNINSNDITDTAYYLRGYRAIDKEIELIQNRDYKFLKLIEKEIIEFKNSNTKLVDYNVYLIETKSLKKMKLILMISIILGLIIGVFYALISNAFKSQTASNKN
tara:strand:+ start:28 stop:1056 length:1029 start_codon:yes stop_codon:yes gene_type:complete